jgi:hypothetical protein
MPLINVLITASASIDIQDSTGSTALIYGNTSNFLN